METPGAQKGETIWQALASCRSVLMRVRTGKRGTFASLNLSAQFPQDRRDWARVHVRLRVGETIESMLWRGLKELQARDAQGMPKPDPRVKRTRELRKLLHSADESRPQ